MTEREAQVILAMAENNCNLEQTANVTYYHRSTLRYHLYKIRDRDGLNFRNPHDMEVLVAKAKEVLQV